MWWIHDRKSRWIVAGLIGLFAIFCLIVLPRVNPPQPARHSYLIAAGGVSRAIVGHKEAPQGQPGRFSPPYRPHHVEFTSSAGPVEVYMVRFDAGDPQAQVDNMTRLTTGLQAGQPPQNPLASGSGREGRIDLPGWWPFGWTQYLVLIRSRNESEVQLVVHYGP